MSLGGIAIMRLISRIATGRPLLSRCIDPRFAAMEELFQS